MIAIEISPLPPFRLDYTVWALRRLPTNEMDRWDGRAYRRVIALAASPVEMEVTQAGPPDAPVIKVLCRHARRSKSALSAIESLARRVLGLDIDLSAFYRLAKRRAKEDARKKIDTVPRHDTNTVPRPVLSGRGSRRTGMSALPVCGRGAQRAQAARRASRIACVPRPVLSGRDEASPYLASIVDEFKGLKPPRMPSVFEAVLNGIACQQITLSLGIALLNRLTAAYGLHEAGGFHAFPRPEDLSGAARDDLKRLGFSGRKADYILGFANAVASGMLDLEALSGLSDDEAITAMMEHTGVGRWTAQYVALRGLGRLDVFPGDDVGGQSRLQRLFQLTDRPGYDEVQRLLAPWRPYRGLLYFHLLLRSHAEKGLLQPPEECARLLAPAM